MRMKKNPMAVALGRMARGVKKTGLTASEIQRRRNLALANVEKMRLARENKKLILANENNGESSITKKYSSFPEKLLT